MIHYNTSEQGIFVLSNVYYPLWYCSLSTQIWQISRADWEIEAKLVVPPGGLVRFVKVRITQSVQLSQKLKI